MKESQRVIGFKLSPLSPEYLYISTSCGRVSKWDWISGKQMFIRGKSRKTISSNLCPVLFQEKEQILLFSILERQNGFREISVSPLDESASGAELREYVVLRTTRPIVSLKAVQAGQVLIVSDSQNLFIGRLGIHGTEAVTSIVCNWTDITLPVKVTSFDLRENSDSSLKPSAQLNSKRDYGSVDLVLGESGGSILICCDIMKTLIPNNGKVLPVLRKLHWHRDAVNAVRWSKDGTSFLRIFADG
jgi:NET1-associated nuclear protein 1 (U3 small nucleolar RNA-associated protein 17)